MRLQIRNATVMLGSNLILDKVSFEIHDNEKIAVVGRNGCGKTTFLKLIAGDVQESNPSGDPGFSHALAGGQTVGFLRQINFTETEIPVRDEICKAFAPIYACRDRMHEIENLLSEDKNADHERLLNEYASLQKKYDALEGDSAEREMEIMFRRFGFEPEDLQRPVGTFSGGQQTKIAFMKLLLSKPDILLLDEPTNHLDLPAIEWLEGYLKNYGKSVVLVSHDRTFLDNVVSVTYEIEYHRMKRYSGNYSSFMRQKEEALLKQEKDYEAQQKEIKRLTEWIEKWKNTPTKVSSAHSKEKVIEHMVLIEKPRRFDETTFRAHFSPRISSYGEVIIASGLKIGYDSVLSETSFVLRRGERLAVVGENGKGKSTLLKTIMGFVPPLGGTFRIGTNVEIGYFDQQKAVINDEDPEQTVLENFANAYPRLTNLEVRSTLGAFAFSQDEVERKLGQLSGGERVRLALCKMFYTKPNLLILDEPTNHMDILGKESLEKMLKSYEGTVLFVSHDRYFIKSIATNVLRIGDEFSASAKTAEDYYLQETAESPVGSGKSADLRRSGGQAAAGAFKNSAGSGTAGGTGSSAAVSGMKNPAGGFDGSGVSADERPDPLLEEYRRNPGKVRAKFERKLEKLNASLAESEEKAESLRNRLEDPAFASDYMKIMSLQEELASAEAEQEEILTEILETEEQLEKFPAV